MKKNIFFILLRKRLKANMKKNIVLFIPISLVLLCMLCSNLITYSINQYINSFEKNIGLRTIAGISYDKNNYEAIKKQLQKISNVEMIVSEYEKRVIAVEYCKQLENEYMDGFVEIHPINVQTCPDIIDGRKITNDDRYVIILPSKICADSKYKNYISEDEFVDGKSLINQDIEIQFENEKEYSFIKKFKVIGIYDSNKYKDTKTPYIPIDVIKEINEEINYIPYEFQLNIVVDKLENLEYVNNYIYDNNIVQKSNLQKENEKNSINMSILEKNFSRETNISLDTLYILKEISYFLFIISIILLIIILLATNFDKTYFSSVDIGIMRMQGYKEKNIQLITIVENIIFCIISFIIAIIAFIVITRIGVVAIDNYISKEYVGITYNKIKEQLYYINQISLKINIFNVGITFLSVALLEICNTYLMNKLIFLKTISQNLKRK